MANKKRIATSVAAVATAAALLLGGTFAWQSVNQTALNEASDVINPGGRLHDDFNGSNKDVYVENFAEENIFARVRLDEYFEITMNKGTPVENNEIVTVGAVKDDVDTYVTHQFDEANATDDYWSWTTGGETVYMPTFNLNKDSLQADINGTYAGLDADPDAGEPYDDYIPTYSVGDTLPGTEVYDADANNIDEIAEGTEAVDVNYKEVPATHTATTTANAELISMQEWNDRGQPVDDYWVYDDDGWVYYAKPIPAGTATGLLLDGIELNQVMDDSWYYAINVVAQFVTADDLGKTDGTGFYDETKGEAPSPEALALLKAIGVNTDGPVMVSNADELKDALAKGESVTLDGEIVANDPPISEEYPTIDSYFLMHEGGTLSGGSITTTAWTDSTLFVNNENGWPDPNDGASEATVNGTNINAMTSWGVRVQALDAPATLNDMTITGEYGGLIAEYSQRSGVTGGGNVIALNDMTITAGSNYPHAGYEWINSAVAAAMGAKVVIDGGTYTGNNAVLILSSGADVTINGGTFEGAIGFASDISNVKKEDSSLVIKGGTFTVDPSDYVADGYEAIYDDDSATWTVQEEVVGEVENYTISFGDKKAIISSDDTIGLEVALLGEDDAPVTEGVTWEVSDTNVVVAEGYVKASEEATMTVVLDKYTVTAVIDGNDVATADLYMYDATYHTIEDYNIVTLDNEKTYCLFESAISMYVSMGDSVTYCVWRFGDPVDAIYGCTESGNFAGTTKNLVTHIEQVVYNSGEHEDIVYEGKCAHMSAYSE